MIALLYVLLASALAGLAAWAGVRLWPRADPAGVASDAIASKVARARGLRGFLRSRLDPAVATGLALTAALMGLAVTGAIIGVVVYMVRARSGVVTIDERIARWAADHVQGAAQQAMGSITWLGSTPVVVALAVATAAYGYWRWRRASIWLFLTIVVGGQFLLMNLTKLAVGRARPDIQRLSEFSGSSFPSGHSTAAAATFAAMALILGLARSAEVRALLMGGAAAIAVAVACSRVLLGVHWFSDVVAGLALGWSWFALCAVAFGGSLLRFGEPAQIATGSAGAHRGSAPPRTRALRRSRARAGSEGCLKLGRAENTSAVTRAAIFDGRRSQTEPETFLSAWPPPAVAASVAFLGYVALAALLISIGLLITGPLIPGPVGAWDDSINRWLLDHRTPSGNTLTDYASMLAGTGTVLTIAGAAVAILVIRRLWRELGFLLVALSVEFSVFLTTVLVIARPRPTVPKLDGAPATSSFPSGHVAASIALYASLAILISARTRHPVIRVVSWVLAVTIVVGVSISRVYRGLHHPIDVFAGLVVGIGAILVAILAIRTADAAARHRAEAADGARTDPEPSLVRS